MTGALVDPSWFGPLGVRITSVRGQRHAYRVLRQGGHMPAQSASPARCTGQAWDGEAVSRLLRLDTRRTRLCVLCLGVVAHQRVFRLELRARTFAEVREALGSDLYGFCVSTAFGEPSDAMAEVSVTLGGWRPGMDQEGNRDASVLVPLGRRGVAELAQYCQGVATGEWESLMLRVPRGWVAGSAGETPRLARAVVETLCQRCAEA